MYEKLSEKDIQFMEFFHDPIAMIENLIPENIDAPSTWDVDCKCIQTRPYQFGMTSYDILYADDFDLDDKQNFQNKIGAGKLISIAARNIGKTFFGMDADIPLTLIHYPACESCISSFDDMHLAPRVDKIANTVENHKFFKMYVRRGIKGSVNRKTGISLLNGHNMKKANEAVEGNKTGQQYHGMHFKKFYYDEYSYTSNEGEEKRIDSKHSHGVIERVFGIPDLRVGSPLGRDLKDEKNFNWICRLPQYVREDWDSKEKERMISKYGGEGSPSYKLNVEAELTEGAFSKFDIARIRKNCYKEDRKIKYFEVNKENLNEFKNHLIVDRMACENVYICSDIGTTRSPSEVIIIFDTGLKYKYEYQISLFKLSMEEQAKVFYWLYHKMGTAFIALDHTNADGRAITEFLLKMGIPIEHISDIWMTKALETGFQLDADGKVILDEVRKPIVKKEITKVFAVRTIEQLFYDARIEIPIDEKFINQFSNYFEQQSGNTKKYGTATEDHLLDSFLLFAICQWENEQRKLKNLKPKKRNLGVI